MRRPVTERSARLIRSSRGQVTAVEVYETWFDVEYDPALPERGRVDFVPEPVIRLQEWDSEVFLHELIHVAFATKPPHVESPWWGDRDFSSNKQETFVRHLSRLLDDIGYKLETST